MHFINVHRKVCTYRFCVLYLVTKSKGLKLNEGICNTRLFHDFKMYGKIK